MKEKLNISEENNLKQFSPSIFYENYKKEIGIIKVAIDNLDKRVKK